MAYHINRFYCSGAEVSTSVKVQAKTGVEITRRFSTITEKVDSIVGSHQSALLRGACPVAAYRSTVEKTVEIVMKTTHKLRNVDAISIINLFLTLRGLGGLGFPHFGAFCSNEVQDCITKMMCSL